MWEKYKKYLNVDRLRRAVQRFARVRLRKVHLDFLVGMLSIPVLVTAIIINWGNLTHKQTVAGTPSPSPQIIIVTGLPSTNSSNVVTALPSCTKRVGPISITSPQEGQSIADNPVCITIDYSDPTYCPVIWSYRINDGSWSDFNNNSPCLYNLPNGKVTFDLRVNSTVSSDSTSLSRSFTYTGSSIIDTPTPTPTVVSTATLTPAFTPTPTAVASTSAN